MPSTASSSTTSYVKLAAAALAAWLVYSVLDAFPYQLGIDFYQFWGVPLAREVGRLEATPYVDQAPYARELNVIADGSSNLKFRNANALRRNIEPMGTPFLYASFSLMPRDFEAAQILYTTLLYLFTAGSVIVLLRMRGVGLWSAVCLAIGVLLTFNPFAQEVRCGNVNALQLAFMSALVWISAGNRFSGRDWLDGLFVGFLALFVVFKPNTPWIALALGLHYLAARGMRAFAIGAIEGVLLALAGFAIGAWEMGGVHAWPEWFRLARGMDGTGMVLPYEKGNLSLAMLVGRVSPLGPWGCGLLLAAVLSAALGLAFAKGGRANTFASARRAFADPWFAASVGIVFTFATSPLVWPHYHVMLLLPIVWLLRPGRPCRACFWGAVVCYFVLSRAVTDPLVSFEMLGLLQLLSLLSWTALLPGILVHARDAASAVPAVRAPPRDSLAAG